ncbi:MAG TPA: HAD family hydrolase [Chloroflexota bacterium]|nr:HAD family hydrolase [Chloroflexota bacterium]
MSLAAIFFDLDGTLCAPTVPFDGVFGAVVAPLLQRRAGLTLDDLLRSWAAALLKPGPATTAECFRALLNACGSNPNDGIADGLAAALNRRWAASQALAPGAKEALQRLGASWPLGLITNGPSDAQRAVVDVLGISDSFRWLLVSGDADVGVRKPDPAIFAHAAQRAGCAPREALYVGDSAINDVAGAAAAGWYTCWLNPAADDLPSSIPEPDLTMPRLDALLGVLAAWPGAEP